MSYKKRNLLSQNFLINRRLVNKLIQETSIDKNDTVLEIGPGKGIITYELLQKSSSVLAVEIDQKLINFLNHRFTSFPNFILFHQDFLNFPIPKSNYKVFSNLPFSIEGQTIRKLIDASNPPQDCYLVIRKELAYRLSGLNNENQFSLIHKPWFDFEIIHHFKTTDFQPSPKVESVLFRFGQRQIPILPINQKNNWTNFIKLAFGQGLPIYQNLKNKYRPINLKYLNLEPHIKPGWLSFKQWLNLYHHFNH